MKINNYLIKEYLKKLTCQDIINYGHLNNIEVSYKDANILLHYAKNYWQTFLYQDPTYLFKEIKEKINYDLYQKVYKLYILNKIKYLN